MIGDLDKRRKAGRAALAAARTPAGAGEGRQRARGRRRARPQPTSAGSRRAPPSPRRRPAIERALGNAAAAYRRLARARTPAAFRRATAGVTRAERAVAAQFARLEPLGYAAG